jgi:SAM-dependent methyltransferase
LTLAQLRQQAVNKFGDSAHRMYFMSDALEQASDPLISRYRSVGTAGLQVIDAGCGIGADSLALAQAGAHVLGLDIDPVRIAMARLNAAALGLSARFEVADITADLPPADRIFFDPARRDDHDKRLFHVEQYRPPLSTIRRWPAPQIVAKLSPGVQLDQLAAYDGQVEFISVKGALKEAVLWIGFDRHALRATLIAEEQILHWDTPPVMPTVPITEPQNWLIEPDASLLRAGLVEALAADIGAAQLDKTIAYLTSVERPSTAWARCWRVEDWMPFQLKSLRAYLRARDVGRITVKKRGVAITPDELTAKLKLRGKKSCTLVLTRCQGEPIVLVCADYAA